jgi:serine/threonine-protein kinase
VSLEPGTVVGRYTIVRKLAEGGMAEIFLATALGPGGFEKDVVIKRIRPGFADDASFVQMFVDEARVVSRLSHGNIVQIFDFDRHGETYFLAMEYVRGRSLSEANKRARELSVPIIPVLAAQICQEVARGLGYAHRLSEEGRILSLVHRDVTPHNVLLSYDGAVKLTDFGIAKASTRATAAGMLKGKFAYMSPEQARGESIDPRTDIFALGIVLWELLTGGRLFDADSDLAVLRAVQERRVLPPSLLNPAVDPGLDEIVLRALQRDPTSRYGSAYELERGLASFVLKTSRSPEETDVGAWMRELFPIEAKRAEPSVSRPVSQQSASRSSRVPVGAPAVAAVAPPPVAGSAIAPTVLSNPAAQPAPPPVEHSVQTPVTATGRTQPSATPATKATFAARIAALRGWVGSHRRQALAAGGAALVLLVCLGVLGAHWGGPAAPVEVKTPKETSLELKPPPMPMPVPSPEPAPPTPIAVPGPVSTEPGVLLLTVKPWGAVYVDGKRVRREHVGTHEYVLTPGKHTLSIHGPKTSAFEVEVQPGERSSRVVELR